MIIFGEAFLRRALREYVAHYKAVASTVAVNQRAGVKAAVGVPQRLIGVKQVSIRPGNAVATVLASDHKSIACQTAARPSIAAVSERMFRSLTSPAWGDG
jgi:hypothetical protein